MERIRFAFAGFRHGHINALYALAKSHPRIEIVAACEEHEKTRTDIHAAGNIKITHDSCREMLDKVPCDVVATGDYYSNRGPILIEALRRGKHAISDKPLCTSLAELDQIERLAREKKLAVGCQLDMRDTGVLQEARRRIRAGEIGEVHAIAFGGQHPLLWGKRAAWYFEPGKHGGTINDIAVHALDAIPWITGRKFTHIEHARAWNARLKEAPHFQDAAQMTLRMDNGCGVQGDVSYLGPDGCGYGVPQYWRITFWGAKGLLELSAGTKQLTLCRHDMKSPQNIPVPEGTPGAYLESFLAEIRGETKNLHLSSAEVLQTARLSLRVQEAADKHQTNVAV